jgi:hypothetical protein
MERNLLLAAAALFACCFGGWACSSSQEDSSSTYTDTETLTDTNTGTGTQTGTSGQPDAAIDAVTPAPNCGGEYQSPCSGACNPGLRQQYIAVLVGENATAVLACVPCPMVSDRSLITGPVECANFGILYNIAFCSYFYNGLGVAATEQCDGVDNDCNGLIDDGPDPCLAKGSAWICTKATAQTTLTLNSSATGKSYSASYPVNSCVDTCTHSCTGKACGNDDGCGISCNGSCPLRGQACVKNSSGSYSCGTCSPACSSIALCGDDDGCGKPCKGTCPSGQKCLGDPLASNDGGIGGGFDGGNPIDAGASSGSSTNYSCKTDPCLSKACGDPDGYGGKCATGLCSSGSKCTSVSGGYQCVCTPTCTGKACGASDGCTGICSSGTCPTGQSCVANVCKCVPSCSGKNCGSDGCGGSCGSCTDALYTCESGVCRQTKCYSSGGSCTSDAQCCTSSGVACCLGAYYGISANTCNCAYAD